MSRQPRARRAVSAALTAAIATAMFACAARPPAVPGAGGAAAPPVASAPTAEPDAGAPRTIADRFITTFWCGPPLHFFDDARAREIADAGFNLIGATCEGPVNPQLNRRALRIAQRHGLAMIIKDNRVSASAPLTDGWQERADAALAAYAGHPALAGFFLVDEPNDAAIYPDIAALRRRIRRHDRGLIGYVNLLPDYVFPGPEDYRDYVESYLFRTRPDLLSYDHYPFLVGADRPSFFANLALIREAAIEYEVPFLLIVQLMPHADYREPDAAELAWQVFQALAFGARGISYFAYWTPTQVPDNIAYRFRRGIIEGGLPTVHYDRVAALNRRIRAVAAALDGHRSTGVWDSLGRVGNASRPEPLHAVRSGAVVAGTFRGADGAGAVLLANRGYREVATVELRGPGVEVFDDRAQTWTPAPPTLELPPGEGRLIRHGPTPRPAS